MPRSKNKREYGFKPVYKEFGPTDHKDTGSVTLDHDEMEAVFLMDSRGLYQDEAAKKMNVSRPTFSRIIKSARFKIATALVSGKQLRINDEKTSLTLMICTAEKNSFHAIAPVERYIAFVHINSRDDYSVEYIDNPVVTKGTKPALELPKIAAGHNVNFYISDKAGAGLVNSLLATGVFYEKQNPGFSLQTLVKAFAQTYLSDS